MQNSPRPPPPHTPQKRKKEKEDKPWNQFGFFKIYQTNHESSLVWDLFIFYYYYFGGWS